MKQGEHWYSMQDPEGEPQGYARLVVSAEDEGARRVEWELHLAFPGGTYEEARSAVFDAEGGMLSATYEDAGSRVEAERRGERLVGRVVKGDEEQPLDMPFEADAVGGMGFMLACDLPFEAGHRQAHHDYNEAQGFKPEGSLTLDVRGAETLQLPGGAVSAWKMVLTRQGGSELPIWVDADRRIVQTDWGGGNLMIVSESSTEHLFQPAPPLVVPMDPDDLSAMVVEGVLEGAEPDRVFAFFTDPERLKRWWPQEAEVGDGVGGPYVLAWPQAEWTLRGEITTWAPGRELGFTWAWDHMPERPTYRVEVTLEAAEGGTRLRIRQGPYGDAEADQKDRHGHLEGWQSVTARLQAALAG